MKRKTHRVPESRKRPRSPKQIAHTAALCAWNVGRQGRHPSPEARAKQRAGQMGNKNSEGHVHSPESLAKMRAAMMGNKNAEGYRHTPETIEKMRAASMGNKNAVGCVHSPEHRAKQRAANMGPNGSNWQGGISRDPYGWDFNDALKEEVRRRDGHRCQLCGTPQAECRTSLPVHHVDYDKTNSDPVNLVALCAPCHAKTNKNRKHWTALFQEKAIRRNMAELKN